MCFRVALWGHLRFFSTRETHRVDLRFPSATYRIGVRLLARGSHLPSPRCWGLISISVSVARAARCSHFAATRPTHHSILRCGLSGLATPPPCALPISRSSLLTTLPTPFDILHKIRASTRERKLSERLRDYVVDGDDTPHSADSSDMRQDVAEVPVMPLTATLPIPAPPGLMAGQPVFSAAMGGAYMVPGATLPAFYAPPPPMVASRPSRPARHRSRSPPSRDAKSRRGGATGFASKHPGTSSFRGVSWHTQTSRWKAQIKVNGRDINLGRHKDEVAAARAYDRAAICARGIDGAKLNFPVDDYREELDGLQSTALDELAASLRGVEERMQAQTSRFHGVRLNKRTGKWEAYIRVNGKHVHLGCYDHEVAAAQAFDQAAIVRHAYNLGAMGGKPSLVTNFPPDYYQTLLEKQQQREEGVGEDNEEEDVHDVFYKLGEKYIDSLVEKCKESAGGDYED